MPKIVSELTIAGKEMVETMAIGAQQEQIDSVVVASIPVDVVYLKNARFGVKPTTFASATSLSKQCGLGLTPISQTSRHLTALLSQVMQMATLRTVACWMVADSYKLLATISASARLSGLGALFGARPRTVAAIGIRAYARERFLTSGTTHCDSRQVYTLGHEGDSYATHI